VVKSGWLRTGRATSRGWNSCSVKNFQFSNIVQTGAWSWPPFPISAEVKETWVYTSTPPYVFTAHWLVTSVLWLYFEGTPWPESASELYRPSERRLSTKLVLTFADRRCTWSAWRIPTTVISISRPKPLLFLPSSSTLALTRLSGPRSIPTTCQKIC
jgi:hypothetical protein